MKSKTFSQLLRLSHSYRVSSTASLPFHRSSCSTNRNTICLLDLWRKITTKILLRIVLLFYPGASYSVNLNFSGFFLHHILVFYTLFCFINSEIVQVHQLNHQHLLWYCLSTFQQPDRGSPLEIIIFHCVCISWDQFQDFLGLL